MNFLSSGISNPAIKDILQGIALIARGTYDRMTAREVDDDTYLAKIKQVDDLVYGVDNKFYKELVGKPDAMKNIIEWINNYLTNQKE